MIKDLLKLTTVDVAREAITPDGMGGATTTTTLTTLTRAALWQVTANERFISDRIAKVSSHILALEHGAYTFNNNDKYVVYNSNTYTITGEPDDVFNNNELIIVGLKQIT